MTPPTTHPRFRARAAALAGAGALTLLAAACADDPTRPAAAAAAGGRATDLRPNAGITIIPVYSVTVTDLGTLGAATTGQNESRAYGINDSGYVTGGSTRTGFSTIHDNAFRWHNATGMLYAGLRATGRDINLSNTIVGETYILGGPGPRAFSLNAGGAATDLGFLPYCFESWAQGVNDAGYAVGQSRECYPDSTGWFRAGTRWDPWGGKVAFTLGSSWQDRVSALFDINNANQTVGTASDSGGLKVGFRYTPAVGYELIKPWSSSVSVVPQAINASGTVGGYETSLFGTFPFRWSPAAGFTYLGGGPGKVFGLSASNYAVGFADSSPVFWKPDGTRMALPRLAGPFAPPCSESQCSAQDVNGRLEIVGYDRTAAGAVHAVIWRVKVTYKIIVKLYPFEPFRPIYLGKDDLIPVAVLGTPDFDPREIKPTLFRLGNDDGNDTPMARDPYGRSMYSFQDVDKDGRLDLLLYFSQAAMEKNRDLTPETSVLYVTGDLGGGEFLRGAQKVEVVRQ